mmetsp:Transcript_86145/g.248749  ORF Transcript_86145/g.248749 Transcript_86145/m.248749 type:complete len:999 (-) Transcript_86145:98-3094(-)
MVTAFTTITPASSDVGGSFQAGSFQYHSGGLETEEVQYSSQDTQKVVESDGGPKPAWGDTTVGTKCTNGTTGTNASEAQDEVGEEIGWHNGAASNLPSKWKSRTFSSLMTKVGRGGSGNSIVGSDVAPPTAVRRVSIDSGDRLPLPRAMRTSMLPTKLRRSSAFAVEFDIRADMSLEDTSAVLGRGFDNPDSPAWCDSSSWVAKLRRTLRGAATAKLLRALALPSAVLAPCVLSFESSCEYPKERLLVATGKWAHLVCSVLYSVLAIGQWCCGSATPYSRLAMSFSTIGRKGRRPSESDMDASSAKDSDDDAAGQYKTSFFAEPGDWFVFDLLVFAGLGAEAWHLGEEAAGSIQLSQYVWLLSAAKVWRWIVPHDRMDDVRSHAVEGFWFLIARLFTYFFLFTHLCACLLAWAAVVHFSPESPSWADDTGSLAHETRSCTDFYMAAFYFAAYTVTSIGHGDIVPANNFERGVDSIVMIVSQLYVAKLFADLNFIISTHNHWRAQRHQRLTQTAAALTSMGVPLVLRKRVLAYQDFIWEVQKERRAKESLRDLSDSLREELQTIVYQRLVSHAPFLHHLSVEALRHIISSLTDAVYLPSDFIIRRGADGAELYFLREGTAGIFLTVKAPKWDHEEVKVVRRGDYFGEVALLTGQKRTSWVMARMYCVCSMLRKSVIDEVMDRDPSCVVTLATSMKKALNLAPKVTWRDVAEKLDRAFMTMEDFSEWIQYYTEGLPPTDAGGLAAVIDFTWSRYRSLMQHLKISVLDQKLLWIDLDQEERGTVSFRRFMQVVYGGHKDDEVNEFLASWSMPDTPQSGPSCSTGGKFDRPANLKWSRTQSRSCLMQNPVSRRPSNAGMGMSSAFSGHGRMSMGNVASGAADRQAILLQRQVGDMQERIESRLAGLSRQVTMLVAHFSLNLSTEDAGDGGDGEDNDTDASIEDKLLMSDVGSKQSFQSCTARPPTVPSDGPPHHAMGSADTATPARQTLVSFAASSRSEDFG